MLVHQAEFRWFWVFWGGVLPASRWQRGYNPPEPTPEKHPMPHASHNVPYGPSMVPVICSVIPIVHMVSGGCFIWGMGVIDPSPDNPWEPLKNRPALKCWAANPLTSSPTCSLTKSDQTIPKLHVLCQRWTTKLYIMAISSGKVTDLQKEHQIETTWTWEGRCFSASQATTKSSAECLSSFFQFISPLSRTFYLVNPLCTLQSLLRAL